MEYSDLPQNKYSKIYIAFMQSRLYNTKVKGQTESHHIFPLSIFGKNKLTLNLTHREHFIAHMLLWKMYRKEYGVFHIWTRKMYNVIYHYSVYRKIVNGIETVFKLNSRGFSTVRALSQQQQSNTKESK